MKAKIFLPVLFVLLVVFSMDVFAQRGGRGTNVRPQQRIAERPAERFERPRQMMYEDCILPDLTEEQQAALKEHRLARLEASTGHRAQMNELRARKRNLMIQPESNREAIHAVIDEKTSLRNTMMKERVSHRQIVRGLLTEEQRIVFDSQGMRGKGGQAPRGRGENAPRMRCW